jgi:hypothetical protein
MPGLTQNEQVRNSDLYNDALAAGSGLELAENTGSIENDLNHLRSQMRRIINGTGGKWYDALLNDFGLDQIHDKPFAFRMPFRPVAPNAASFTLGGAVAGIVTPNTQYPGGVGIVAVGGGSTADGGFIVADEANFTVVGTLGVGLSKVTDVNGTVLSAVDIIDAATNQPPVTGTGETIFGLLQVVTGTADGAAIGGAASENVQIAFVYVDDSTDVITSTTLPAATYHYAPSRLNTFYSLARGSFLSPGGAVAESGGTVPKLPFREIQITGTKPLANDPFTITTGTFTTAGAQTVVSSDQTVAMPATGAAFRDDSRVEVYRNGVLQSKGASAAPNRDVYWVSSTQLAFETALKLGDVIYIRTPSAF